MQKEANATSELITRYSGPSFGLFCKKSKTTVVVLEQLQIGQLPKVANSFSSASFCIMALSVASVIQLAELDQSPVLPQLPEDHKPKSDLHSTLPLYVPASVASLVQSLYWTVALLFGGGHGVGGGGAVRAKCDEEGDFAECAGRVTAVSSDGGG